MNADDEIKELLAFAKKEHPELLKKHTNDDGTVRVFDLLCDLYGF